MTKPKTVTENMAMKIMPDFNNLKFISILVYRTILMYINFNNTNNNIFKTQ